MKMLANAIKRKNLSLAPLAASEVEEQMDKALEFELVSDEEQIHREERHLMKKNSAATRTTTTNRTPHPNPVRPPRRTPHRWTP